MSSCQPSNRHDDCDPHSGCCLWYPCVHELVSAGFKIKHPKMLQQQIAYRIVKLNLKVPQGNVWYIRHGMHCCWQAKKKCEGAVCLLYTLVFISNNFKILSVCWAEARRQITRTTLAIKHDRNWISFQSAKSALLLSVMNCAIAPSASLHCRTQEPCHSIHAGNKSRRWRWQGYHEAGKFENIMTTSCMPEKKFRKTETQRLQHIGENEALHGWQGNQSLDDCRQSMRSSKLLKPH